VKARLPIKNANSVFVLGWGSGAPAALSCTLGGSPSVRGGFIHSSVYNFSALPDPALARGKRLYLLQPTRAAVLPKSQAEAAKQRLTPHAAALQLTYYDGGYGWHGDVYGQLRRGIIFLEGRLP
jgi:predicted esterase